MKKILYFIYIMGLLISLQSCERVGNLLNGTNESQQTVGADGESNAGTEGSMPHRDSAKTAEMQLKLQQKDSVINVLADSLSGMGARIEVLQTNLQSLKKEQANLQNDKVGVKNLFVYLAIFTLVLVILVILLVKKLTKSSSLSEERVKRIVTYMSNKHPEIVCASVNPILTQHASIINNLSRDMKTLKSQVDGLANKLSDKEVSNSEDCHKGQQSWESQVVPSPKQASVKNNVFYMKRPLGNMEFDLSLKSLNPTEETLYRFEIDDRNPNVATFYFDCGSPATIRMALSTKDKTLDRVCNATGDSTNGRYTCTSPGEAKFQNGKWVVTRKAVVIFD